MMYRTIWKMW